MDRSMVKKFSVIYFDLMGIFQHLSHIFKGNPVTEPSSILPTMSPEAKLHVLDSLESLEEALTRSEREPVLVFKHSTMCGISSMARRRLLELREAEDPPVYELVIQASRSLSNELAGLFDIRHQSPQIILIHQRKPVYHTSHGLITAENVRIAQNQALAP